MKAADLARLASDVKDVRAVVCAAVADVEDGGTCNLDAPMVIEPRLGPLTARKLEALGVSCFEHRGQIILGMAGVGGQANRRCAGARLFAAKLAEKGWETSVWYQAD